MEHPGRKLGTPTRTNPITGLTRETTAQKLRRTGEDHGWDFRWDHGDYVFEKPHARLRVRFWEGTITTGTLHRDDNGRGRSVRSERVWDVLRGAECICPPFTTEDWTRGKDHPVSLDCAVCR